MFTNIQKNIKDYVYQSRKTVIEMLEDRGYNTQGLIKDYAYSQYLEMFNVFDNYSGVFDINLTNKRESIYIKFVSNVSDKDQAFGGISKNNSRRALKELSELKTFIESQHQVDKIIFIICYGDEISEHFHDFEEQYSVQIFHVSELIFNVTHHELVPKHVKISEREKRFLLNKLMLESEYKLPYINPTDIIARYLGLKEGDVCKIFRHSQTSALHICYRVCCDEEGNEQRLTKSKLRKNINKPNQRKPVSFKQVVPEITNFDKEIRDSWKKTDIESSTITVTFGDQAENHAGMQILSSDGPELESGISGENLAQIKTIVEDSGYTTELINLEDTLDTAISEYMKTKSIKEGGASKRDPEQIAYISARNKNAQILIIRNGVEFLLGDQGNSDGLFNELKILDMDARFLSHGRVVNKRIRQNLCFADISQKPDYQEGKGRVINFTDIPLTNTIRNSITSKLNIGDEGDENKLRNLVAEANYYLNLEKCGIRYHGDSERKVVLALRLGKSMPLYYQWYYQSKAYGDRTTINLNHGDIYIMSDKAVGYDWKQRNKFTLRHAAGCIN